VTDHTAVGVRVSLNTGFHAARARLKILVKGGTLLRASKVAYGEGITGLAELAGPAVGLTRLAGVCLEDLTETDDCAHIALQWEAIAADGKLFTALLADLMLIPAGDQITALSVTGTYWPPPGRPGAGLGQAIVRCCATAVIGIFLDSVACELGHPAGIAGLLAGRDDSRKMLPFRPHRRMAPAHDLHQARHRLAPRDARGAAGRSETRGRDTTVRSVKRPSSLRTNAALRSADAAARPLWPRDDRVMETASRGRPRESCSG
jgi:hypothetical protein